MPLYEYECRKCGHRFEKIEKVNDATRRKCPRCKGTAERLVASPAIQFKGSGWYVTDYARKGASSESKDAGPAPAEAGGSSSAKDAKETKDTKESKPAAPAKGSGKSAKRESP